MDFAAEADFSAAAPFDFAPFYSAKPAVGALPFLFNVPHAGRRYPQSFMAQSRLDRRAVRASEDCYVDRLFAAVTGMGARFMAAQFPRAFLDVNRPPLALDSALFADLDTGFATWAAEGLAVCAADGQTLSALRAGFGVVPRNVAANQPIYRGKLAVSEALARLLHFYFPYHAALSAHILALKNTFGEAVLLDCHSMPGIAAYYPGQAEPDIVLGNRFGQSCCAQLTDLAQALLEDMGYRVACNIPYAGGHITARYGRPQAGIHALQIEINRSLYLNPHNLRPSSGFNALQADMEQFAARLMQAWQRDYPLCAAAE